MNRTGSTLLLLGVACLVGGLAASCARKSGGTQAASANPGQAGKGASVTFAPAPAAGSGRQQPRPSRAASLSSLQGNDRLVAMSGGATIYPYDYTIGALQSTANPAGNGAEVRAVVLSFFSSLEAGKVDENLVASRWRNEIIRTLSYPIAAKEMPDSVRVGAVTVDGASAHARILMMKNTGIAAGEIYLIEAEGHWLISDVQADFSQLLVPFTRKEPFDPAQWTPPAQE